MMGRMNNGEKKGRRMKKETRRHGLDCRRALQKYQVTKYQSRTEVHQYKYTTQSTSIRITSMQFEFESCQVEPEKARDQRRVYFEW